METTNHIAYDIDKSSQRMDDILGAGNGNFSDSDSIPQRSLLTYTNGYYVNVTALFIDIIGSSDMTDEHKRPTLAKIYRCFISECTALMNSQTICKEININGDCVWGVFETPYKSDIDTVFSIAARLNSLIKILNYKLRKKGYSQISVGIGMDYGRALMVLSLIHIFEKIESKPIPFSTKIAVEREDFEHLSTLAKKYVAAEKKEFKLQKALDAANRLIAKLKVEIVG